MTAVLLDGPTYGRRVRMGWPKTTAVTAERKTEMEIQPGKQMFIDDFFIESMVGAHRVLNRQEKRTVDQPLHIISPEMLWEKGQATGPVIYDEKNQTFRMYYHGVENCVCVLESPDGIEEEHRIWQVFARQGRDREQPPWTTRNTTQPVEFPETHENWTTDC